jgi:hypothetical protein
VIRAAILSCSAALAGLAALTSVAGAAQRVENPSAPEPLLRLAGRAPLVLEGRLFKPGESVRVVVLTGYGPVWSRVVAAGGRFKATFHVPQAGCGAPFAARAVGAGGSTASLVLGRAAVCVPPPRD